MVCLGVGASAGCVGSSENDLACSCFIIAWLVFMISYHDDELVSDVFVGKVIYYGVYCAEMIATTYIMELVVFRSGAVYMKIWCKRHGDSMAI